MQKNNNFLLIVSFKRGTKFAFLCQVLPLKVIFIDSTCIFCVDMFDVGCLQAFIVCSIHCSEWQMVCKHIKLLKAFGLYANSAMKDTCKTVCLKFFLFKIRTHCSDCKWNTNLSYFNFEQSSKLEVNSENVWFISYVIWCFPFFPWPMADFAQATLWTKREKKVWRKLDFSCPFSFLLATQRIGQHREKYFYHMRFSLTHDKLLFRKWSFSGRKILTFSTCNLKEKKEY